MNRTMMYVLSGTVAVLLLASTFVGGMLYARLIDFAKVPGISTEATLRDKVGEVQALLRERALEPAEDSSMTAGAIQGLLESGGDKYATYFNPEHYKYFTEQSDGAFYGIGVNIAEKDGNVYIVSIIEGTPAESVGLLADDQFRAVDGKRRDPWTSEEIVKAVRGPEGSKVEVTVYRPSEDKEITVEITRAKIDIPNVMSKITGADKNVGYVRMMSFNAQSAEDVRDAIEKLADDGATTYVLDLRDNPGGLLQEAVDMASLFVDDGVIVRVEERGVPEETMRANPIVKTFDADTVPLVVLINENSASASEVLGGALQDYDRARLVGVQSFGKGSVQTIEELSFGGAVKFTTAHYLTPKSRVIDGKGLTPDIVVEMKPELQADEKTDTQLAKAIAAAEALAK